MDLFLIRREIQTGDLRRIQGTDKYFATLPLAFSVSGTCEIPFIMFATCSTYDSRGLIHGEWKGQRWWTIRLDRHDHMLNGALGLVGLLSKEQCLGAAG